MGNITFPIDHWNFLSKIMNSGLEIARSTYLNSERSAKMFESGKVEKMFYLLYSIKSTDPWPILVMNF